MGTYVPDMVDALRTNVLTRTNICNRHLNVCHEPGFIHLTPDKFKASLGTYDNKNFINNLYAKITHEEN